MCYNELPVEHTTAFEHSSLYVPAQSKVDLCFFSK